jgi:hypothetical protein
MAYHLVQRCKSYGDTPNPERGFDGHFRCEYMGSAEFEFGAIPDSLKRMRKASDLVRKHRMITFDGLTRNVWFVGSLATLKFRVDEFEEWVAKGFRGKESTYFPENFTRRDSWDRTKATPDFMADTVLWWALNEDVMFCLDVEVADRALAAIEAKAAV